MKFYIEEDDYPEEKTVIFQKRADWAYGSNVCGNFDLHHYFFEYGESH